MSGQSAVKRRTPNLNLALINFNFPSWADEAHKNMLIMDGVITALGGVAIRGIWQNDTIYVVGDRLSDPDTGQIYLCNIDHTSASTGTFSADRIANPTYWTIVANLPVSRGAWEAAVIYNVGDVVRVGDYAYWFCIEAHTSSAEFATDSDKWELVFDATSVVTDANAAKDAAETAASNAQTSETNASTSETNAATSASNASTSETNAGNSASAAATSETNAGNSATAAATSETNAGTSETNAATSESNAATSASNAATSETNAGNSETKASEWADKAENDPVEDSPDRFSAMHWAMKAAEVVGSYRLRGAAIKFEESGTYTPDAEVKAIIVEGVGGGGAGGDAAATDSNQCAIAGGGGAGGYASKFIVSPAEATIIIGAGGVNGGNGGSTIYDDGTNVLTCLGGKSPGLVTAIFDDNGQGRSGEEGGDATGGDTTIKGGWGHSALASGVEGRGMSGNGGNSLFGQGGRGAGNSGSANNIPGEDATGYGAGGGGGINSRSQSLTRGGNGSQGLVKIREFI